MFDLTTILTLIAPAVIGPLGCVAFLKAIARAEAARHDAPVPAPAKLVRDSAVAPASADVAHARQVA